MGQDNAAEPWGDAWPLGNYGNRDTPPSAQARLGRQVRRGDRHKLKAAQRRVTGSKSSRLCWQALAAMVDVEVGPEFMAHVTGIKRCGSPWSCPVCAPVVRERRAQEIDLGLGVWLELRRGGAFVTFTTRHHRADALSDRLDVVATALRTVLNGRPWERRAAALGYVGAIRAVEITWGSNGWHPHCHAALLFDRPLDADQLRDLGDWMHARWSAVLERRGLGSVTRDHGVDVRPITRNELGSYLTKVDGGWGVGLELARSDLKTARAGGRNPVSILREFVDTGEAALLALWLEYEGSTYGKRAIVWSRGLRARLLGDEQDQADEQLAAAEGADVEVLLRALVPAPMWARHVRAGSTGALLSRIEEAAAAGARGVVVESDEERELVG